MPQLKTDLNNLGPLRLMTLDTSDLFLPFGRPIADYMRGGADNGNSLCQLTRQAPIDFPISVEWREWLDLTLEPAPVECAPQAAPAEKPTPGPEVATKDVKPESEPPEAGFFSWSFDEIQPRRGAAAAEKEPPAAREAEVQLPAGEALPLRPRVTPTPPPASAPPAEPAPSKPVAEPPKPAPPAPPDKSTPTVVARPAPPKPAPPPPVAKAPTPVVSKPVPPPTKPASVKVSAPAAPPAEPPRPAPEPESRPEPPSVKTSSAPQPKPTVAAPPPKTAPPAAKSAPAPTVKPPEPPRAKPAPAVPPPVAKETRETKVEEPPQPAPAPAVPVEKPLTLGERKESLFERIPMVLKAGLPLLGLIGGLGYYIFIEGQQAKPPSRQSSAQGISMGEQGWVTEWASDAVGSRRARQLTIYRPSARLSDYTFEFTGVIETKALGWVFRAVDTKNYYGVKIEVLKAGPNPTMGLTRFAIVEGRESSVSQKVLPINARPDSAYRVKLDVAGPHFTVHVQGQPAEVWTDSRLRSGAIGFMNERDERARTTSVQVTYPTTTPGR